jgi:hypothetical protein
MAQRKYVFLGLVAVLALVVTGTFAVRELTVTSAETSTATMRLKVTTGGTCEAQKCQVAPGGAFTLVVEGTANSAGHIGFGTQINYDAFFAAGGSYTPTAQASAEIIFTDCSYPGIPVRQHNTMTHIVSHGATAGFPPTFTQCMTGGDFVSLAMTCSTAPSSTELLLVPLSAQNTLGSGYKASPTVNVPAKATNVTINCGEPPDDTATPPPGDTATPEGPTATAAPPTETPTAGPTLPPTATFTAAPPTPTRTATATPGEGDNGDANCDGNITSVDSLWVLWEVADIASITCPGGLANADANKDGNITSIDSALILQYVAELIDHLP